MYQSLYRRYRPRRFADVRGQEHVVKALHNAVREDRVGHAYLFSGPRGTGKTTSARILAKVLNCEQPVDGEPCCECVSCRSVEAGTSYDVHELDAASNNGVDNMRDLIEKAMLGTPGRRKVYILDEVHMLSKAAEAALLKTLEEPPAHVVFVLATTDPQKISQTIISRTQHLQFHLLPNDILAEHVRWVIADAGLQVDDDAIEAVLRQGGGSARDTLSALDQVVAAGGVAPDSAPLDEVVEALIEADTGRALAAVAAATAAGRDTRTLTENLVAHLRDAFLSLMAPELVQLPDRTAARVADQAGRLGTAATVRALEVLGEMLVELRHAPDPRLLLDVALVRLTRAEADTSYAALLARVEKLERALASGDAPVARPGAAAVAPAPPSAPAPGASTPAAPAGRAAIGARAGRATPPAAPTAPRAPAPSPPAPLPPAAASSGASAGPVPNRDQLTLVWADHVLPKLKGMARALYSPGRFVESGPTEARFAVPPTTPIGRLVQHRGEVEAALSSEFGRPVAITLVVDHGDAAAPSIVGPGHQGPPDDEMVSLDELVDAAPGQLPPSGLERLAQAFPGAELLDDA